MERKKYNLKIIFLLFKVLISTDLRFCQLLTILKLDKDRFYEEPKETYLKIFCICKQHKLI